MDCITNGKFIYSRSLSILRSNITGSIKRSTMFTPTYTSAPEQTLRQQFANLRRALGDFANALHAAQGREFDPVSSVAPVARSRQQGLTELLSLANQHQQHSPGLSTELRSIASRG
jgi:hypothetical protein